MEQQEKAFCGGGRVKNGDVIFEKVGWGSWVSGRRGGVVVGVSAYTTEKITGFQ